MSLKNEIVEIFKSAARVATVSFSHKANQHETGVLVIDVTAAAATPSVVATIRGVDPLSGKKWDILASAAITGIGTTVLKVGRGLTAAANAVANDVLPPNIEIEFAHADADSITYSAALHLIAGR